MPNGFVFDTIEPTLIAVLVTPGAFTGTFLVKSSFLTVVPVTPVVFDAELSPLLPAFPHAATSAVSTTATPNARTPADHFMGGTPRKPLDSSLSLNWRPWQPI